MTTRASRFARSIHLLVAVFLAALPAPVGAQMSPPPTAAPPTAPPPAAVPPTAAPTATPPPTVVPAPPRAGASERVEQLPPVVVIDSTPLPGLGIPIEKYPGNVQSVPPGDIDNGNRRDVSDTLLRSMGSVNVTASQGNPWQSDLTYRGFLASPLAGSPIGLSMYLDGMRFNAGFGEAINWDLIPQSAISAIDVIPGSNPIFGLNTLGGALAVHTKRGLDFPGAKLEASGGSFGRWDVNGEWGGSRGPLDWFLTFNVLSEDGWREHSPSDLRQVFAKVGYRTAATDVEVAYAFADNTLTGNGLAPESLLARDRNAVHTFPDETQNLMHLVNLRGSHWLTDDLQLSANGFYRHYRRSTANGDVVLACVDDETDRGVFTPAGRPLHLGRCQGSSDGFVDRRGRPLDGELEREAEGEFRRTRTATDDWGVTLQLSHKGRIFGLGNQGTAGVAYDGHGSDFTQSEAEADLVPRGSSVRVRPTQDFETAVDVGTDQHNVGVYVTDTLDATDWLSLTVGARYQRVSIKIRDQSGNNPALDGQHTFQRVSPSAGLTVRPLPRLTLFAAYNEGFRAPTAAELTCADPQAPCNLPNAFVADPPLDPVIARTVELGARGTLPLGDRFEWSLALYRTDLTDDILFTQTETTGAGFFQNVAKTRRQGVEASVRGSVWKRLRYFLSYALVDATYRTNTTLASVTDADGVQVRSGDRIPGVPRHGIKAGAEVAVLDNLWIGADVVSVTGNYLRGDDGNRQAKVAGYTLLSVHARYVPIRQLEIWGRVDNVTNAEYATGGALNWNAFAEPIAVQRFVAPGPPIAGWAGVKLRF